MIECAPVVAVAVVFVYVPSSPALGVCVCCRVSVAIPDSWQHSGIHLGKQAITWMRMVMMVLTKVRCSAPLLQTWIHFSTLKVTC